jgi:16S rRNA U516 pseudouridylate synthase RsuA-like enzyme
MVRLDAHVSSLFGIKQSDARILIATGEVSVHGAPQREPRWQVVLGEEATVTVGGRAPPTGRPFAHRLLLVHKPRGVLSERRRGSAAWNAAHGRRTGEAHSGAHVEAERRVTDPPFEPGTHQCEVDPVWSWLRAARCQTLWDLVPEALGHATLGVFGRLDADTTGLIPGRE